MSLAAVLYVVVGNRGGAGMLDLGPWQGEAVGDWGVYFSGLCHSTVTRGWQSSLALLRCP